MKRISSMRRRRDSYDVERERRLSAAKLFGRGLSQAAVARRLSVSRQTVSRWHAAWVRKVTKPTRGPASKTASSRHRSSVENRRGAVTISGKSYRLRHQAAGDEEPKPARARTGSSAKKKSTNNESPQPLASRNNFDDYHDSYTGR